LLPPRSLFAQALAAWVSAAALVPFLLLSPRPLGGWFSAIALSWLHVLAMGSVAVVAAFVAWIEVRAPGRSTGWRLATAALAALALAAAAVLVPAIREGFEPAFQFLTQTDRVGMVTGEQNPLFGRLRAGIAAHPLLSWGGFAYALPFVPGIAIGVAALRRGPRGSEAGRWLLAGWTIFWVLLTLGQRRYGNDLAPAFAVLFAIVAFALAERLTKGFASRGFRPWVEGFIVTSLLCLFLWPSLNAVYLPRARGSLAALEAGGPPPLRVTRAVAPTLARFMREVRRATPETSAYLSPGLMPAYGVIGHANLGHAIQYGARRATATDPFWWYIGPKNWNTSLAFLASRGEAEALGFAERLRGRYLVTTSEEDPLSVAGQLHDHDGLAVGSRPALARFRLVSESSPGGRGLGEIFRPARRNVIAYKLFEVVPGARVLVEALPGQAVQASLEIRSNQGRFFRYRARGVADEEGHARLVLPYATEPSPLPVSPPRTEALGAYRLEVAGRTRALRVSEQAVTSGEELRVSSY
jgi:asparagine N-glycosylation enzyme membrane subunit Stt3